LSQAKRSDPFAVADRARWAGASIESRVSYLKWEMRAPYPGLMRLLVELNRRRKQTTSQRAAKALLVLWSSGGGKSHFVRLLEWMFPDEESIDQTFRRLVKFEIPANPTWNSMGAALLKAVGMQPSREEDPTDRALDAMERVGTSILVIDNAQNLPERRGPKGLVSVGNWIGKVWDKSTCAVLLLGTPAAEETVLANEQFRRRTPAKIVIPYFSVDTPAAASRFKRFLHEIDRRLPLAEYSNLNSMAAEMSVATYGITDYIIALLLEAVEVAVSEGRERLSPSDLSQAFERHFLDSGIDLNPFADGGPRRALVHAGEPFHDWHTVAQRYAKGGRRAESPQAAPAKGGGRG
jgi:hypothetical protein